MNLLVYIDRGACGHSAIHICCKLNGRFIALNLDPQFYGLHTGVIASNGVNGDKASQQGLPAYGIVVCWCLLSAALTDLDFH